MRMAPLTLTLCLVATEVLALSASQVPSPPRGRWSLDLSGRIRRQTLAELDRIAGALDAQGAGQLGVAVIDSTSGAPLRDFATAVFNRWGIGHAGRNDGVLLFVALGDRKAEIILGDGLGSISTFHTDRIMSDEIVAHFRQADPDGALLSGARALAALLARRVGAPAAKPQLPAEETPLPASPEVEELHAILLGKKPFPNPRPHGWTIDLTGRMDKPALAAANRIADEVYAAGRGRLYLVVFRSAPRYAPSQEVLALARKELSGAAGENLYLIAASLDPREAALAAPALLQLDPDGKRELARIEAALVSGLNDLSRKDTEVVADAALQLGKMALEGPPTRSALEVMSEAADRHGGFLLGGFGAALTGGVLGLMRYLRRRPRRCERCKNMRERLSDQADDVHLDSGQKKEEELGSVDYDVWYCGQCRDALVLRYGAWFSSYARCHSCDFVTARSSTLTLVHATYDHGGTVEVTETCTHCRHVRKYTRHTARLTRSNSSSSRSSSSFGSSSRSSFGGGSSSGRGSSGSW